MKEFEFIKMDTLIVCEIEDSTKMVYQDNFNSIYELVKENMSDSITLLFHISGDGYDKIIKKRLTTLEKQLLIEQNINNFDLFDFLFFNYILEDGKDKDSFKKTNIEELTNVFSKFLKGLKTYRYDTIKHKTFHVKQRRISRKQLEAMEMDFKKWTVEKEYIDEEDEDEE
jgi:hypothetical protein